MADDELEGRETIEQAAADQAQDMRTGLYVPAPSCVLHPVVSGKLRILDAVKSGSRMEIDGNIQLSDLGPERNVALIVKVGRLVRITDRAEAVYKRTLEVIILHAAFKLFGSRFGILRGDGCEGIKVVAVVTDLGRDVLIDAARGVDSVGRFKITLYCGRGQRENSLFYTGLLHQLKTLAGNVNDGVTGAFPSAFTYKIGLYVFQKFLCCKMLFKCDFSFHVSRSFPFLFIFALPHHVLQIFVIKLYLQIYLFSIRSCYIIIPKKKGKRAPQIWIFRH